jgi:hypothetical protein
VSNIFLNIDGGDNPNIGREKINYNFSLIDGGITATTTGATYVSGDTNITVLSAYTSSPGSSIYNYGVKLSDNIVLTSISASSISATTFYSGSTNLSTLLINLETGATFTNSAATPSTIGGISAGSTFSAKTMQQMWDALLYPYQAPAFSSFSLGIASPKEIGYDIGVSQTFTWSTSNPSNVSANTISISGYNLITLNGLANVGTTGVTFTGIVTRNSGDLPGTRSWTIQGTNSNAAIFNTSLSIRWDWKMYAGTSTNTSLTAANITGLTDYNAVKNGFTGTFNLSAGGYKYFCFANVYGSASSFTDTSNNLNVAMYAGYGNTANGFSYDLVSVTNVEGETTTYKVYRTLNQLGSTINIAIT